MGVEARQPRAPTVFSTVAGVLPQAEQDRFARALFRATRGNTYTHFEEIRDPMQECIMLGCARGATLDAVRVSYIKFLCKRNRQMFIYCKLLQTRASVARFTSQTAATVTTVTGMPSKVLHCWASTTVIDPIP